jgi:peroxiredoxin
MNRLAKDVEGLPVRVLGVNMQEAPRQVARVQAKHKLGFDILLDRVGYFGRAYGIYGLPQVMVIDKKGALRFRDYGLPRDILGAVQALAAEP